MMPIELIDIEENIRFDRIAKLKVRYANLTLHLNLKVTRDRRGVYVEMPMVDRGKGAYHLCRWDSKDDSDHFQKAVIDQIKEKCPGIFRFLDHKLFKEKLKEGKDQFKEHKREEKVEPKIEEKPKARSQSKFANQKKT